jgi:hypothetical protein
VPPVAFTPIVPPAASTPTVPPVVRTPRFPPELITPLPVLLVTDMPGPPLLVAGWSTWGYGLGDQSDDYEFAHSDAQARPLDGLHADPWSYIEPDIAAAELAGFSAAPLSPKLTNQR